MKVFGFLPEHGFQLVRPTPPDDFESLTARVDAHVGGSPWAPRSLELVRTDEGRQLQRGDALWLDPHTPVLRATAALALKSTLSPGDLLLPMKCGEEQVYLLRPGSTIDALDEAASTLWRFSDGRIMDIRKHAFREEAIGHLADFYLPGLRFSECYVTDRFVHAWEKAGLRGLRFKVLWENLSEE